MNRSPSFSRRRCLRGRDSFQDRETNVQIRLLNTTDLDIASSFVHSFILLLRLPQKRVQRLPLTLAAVRDAAPSYGRNVTKQLLIDARPTLSRFSSFLDRVSRT